MPSASLRKIDCHVHLLGDGSSGSGCWLRLKSIVHRLMAQVIVREAGLPPSALREGLDALLVTRLAEQVRDSSLDAVVLLAQDLPHRDDGTPLPDQGTFYVPNSYLLAVCARHPDRFIPGVSIHPARPDAMAELERCLQAGARVLKLLPNCLNVDYSAPRHRPFWEKMAESNMILLSHTGGEHSLPVLCHRFADPRLLRFPLECGVTVIAAHCAGRSGLWDADHTAALLAMFDQWPRLFGDNSALCSPLRCRTLPQILPEPVRHRIIHGSDFPIAVSGFGPWRMGLIDRATWRRSSREPNVLERDVFLKRAIGFDDSHFTRMAQLLDNA
ncbi:MAG: amidohydrolase family protein [Verrucomicrobia bacterium]|nr:amidohydrolase family protein [Verrucomicrobiota bacterium]